MKNKTSLIRFTIILFSLANLCCLCCKDDPVPPTGSFSSPQKNSSYFPGDEVMMKSFATDKDGSVNSVEFLLDGTTIATFSTSPYQHSYVVDDLQEGEHLLECVATDDIGLTESWETTFIILPEPNTFTDSRDGNVYRYVTIGDQEWMIDNLAWLPSVSPSTETSDSKAKYYVSEYEGSDVSTAKSTEYYSTYGVLYNWTAANSCCPEGWHLPTDEEWEELQDLIFTNKGPFDKTTYDWGYVWWDLGKHLWHTSGWLGGNGLNTYGFSALPGGGVYYEPFPQDCPGVTASCKCYADFWSATLTGNKGSARALWSQYAGNIGIHVGCYPKGYGISVRCVKDQ
jgi:uncharacterized protein (TIGR02145 family)